MLESKLSSCGNNRNVDNKARSSLQEFTPEVHLDSMNGTTSHVSRQLAAMIRLCPVHLDISLGNFT